VSLWTGRVCIFHNTFVFSCRRPDHDDVWKVKPDIPELNAFHFQLFTYYSSFSSCCNTWWPNMWKITLAHLKTHFFQSAYPTPWRPTIQRALILQQTSALYKFCTYLLTYLDNTLQSFSCCWCYYYEDDDDLHVITITSSFPFTSSCNAASGGARVFAARGKGPWCRPSNRQHPSSVRWIN